MDQEAKSNPRPWNDTMATPLHVSSCCAVRYPISSTLSLTYDIGYTEANGKKKPHVLYSNDFPSRVGVNVLQPVRSNGNDLKSSVQVVTIVYECL